MDLHDWRWSTWVVMHVLVLNSGSSSLKFGLYRVDASSADVLVDGEAEAIGARGGGIRAHDGDGRTLLDERGSLPDARAAVERIGRFLDAAGLPPVQAIGHRVVHGGPTLRSHCRIDEAIVATLQSAAAFAPLHVPAALAAIRYATEHFPSLPQVACFDTAFHAHLDPRARTLPLPLHLRDEGVERYGFHGLSCESIVAQLGVSLPARVVVAHLGGGASVTAIRDGRSIDTSMGLTPTGGVMMGTRSGDLDPGVLLYLMRTRRLDVDALEDLLDHRSGLVGVSGLASDVRELRRHASDPNARLALEMFCYAVGKAVAAMIAALDGIDLLVFTGGIGEHDAASRAAICEHLDWIGVRLDATRNASATGFLQREASRCAITVLPSLEDARIARHCARLVAG